MYLPFYHQRSFSAFAVTFCLNCETVYIVCLLRHTLFIRQQEERERQAQLRGAPTMDPDIAATKIQKIWKGFSQRKKTKRMREEELIFVGMVRSRMEQKLQSWTKALGTLRKMHLFKLVL